MPDAVVQDYHDSPAARAELVEYLIKTGDVADKGTTWEERLAHWWDANPAAHIHPARGWEARVKGKLVGFGGLIPTAYALDGKEVPVLLATTGRVEHDTAAITICMKMRALGREVPIFHTTPIEKIQHMLQRMKAVAEISVARRIFLTGAWRYLRPGRAWPQLPAGIRLTTQLSEVRALERPFQQSERLEKWTTLESLRWYCDSPMRFHAFVGAVDEKGLLTSFIILTPRELRGLPAWDIIESFTTRDSFEELQALAGELARNPAHLTEDTRLLTVASFPSDRAWEGTSSLMTRPQSVCHYFMLPTALRDVPKQSVMAEGDLGL